jgi:hypothetical protein
MPSLSAPHLRLTVERLPRPTDWEQVLDLELQEKGGFPFMGGRSRSDYSHSLPLELLPVLARVDLGSEESILAFAQSIGVLGAWRDLFRVMDLTSAQMGGPSGVGRRAPFDVEAYLERTGIDIAKLIRARERHAGWGSDPNGEFVDEFRVGAGGLLGLLAIQRELEAKSFSARRLARSWPRYCPWRTPEDKAWAWGDLIDLTNTALASASLSLAWVRAGGIVAANQRGFRPGPPVAPVVSTPESLYGACALELADHILAGYHYRICANETCGRLFSVQEGRSRYGGHRTDNLKFHSPACKDAQAAREYRRRKAAERTRRKR